MADGIATNPPRFSGKESDYHSWRQSFAGMFYGIDGMAKYFHPSTDDELSVLLADESLTDVQRRNMRMERWMLWRALDRATEGKDCQGTVQEATTTHDGYVSLLALRRRYEPSIEQRRTQTNVEYDRWDYDESKGFMDNLGDLDRLSLAVNKAYGTERRTKDDVVQKMIVRLGAHRANPMCAFLWSVFIGQVDFTYEKMRRMAARITAELGDGTHGPSDPHTLSGRNTGQGASTVASLPVAGAAQERRQLS